MLYATLQFIATVVVVGVLVVGYAALLQKVLGGKHE